LRCEQLSHAPFGPNPNFGGIGIEFAILCLPCVRTHRLGPCETPGGDRGEQDDRGGGAGPRRGIGWRHSEQLRGDCARGRGSERAGARWSPGASLTPIGLRSAMRPSSNAVGQIARPFSQAQETHRLGLAASRALIASAYASPSVTSPASTASAVFGNHVRIVRASANFPELNPSVAEAFFPRALFCGSGYSFASTVRPLPQPSLTKPFRNRSLSRCGSIARTMSLMIIFGAGASYDSFPDIPAARRDRTHMESRPPLSNTLFAPTGSFWNFIDRYPQCRPVIPRLRNLPSSGSVEQELERLRTEAEDPERPDPERLRQLAAIRFYIQGAMWQCHSAWLGVTRHITNYLALLDQIRHFGNEDVTLVTFNYEGLLETAACELVGRQINAIDDYLEIGHFAVFKVHGSVNWGREVAEGKALISDGEDVIAQKLIDHSQSLRITDRFVFVNTPAPIVRDAAVSKILFPAVAVPVQTKQDFECPPSHLDELKRRLGRIDRMLIVGWRGLDAHFVALMKAHLPTGVRLDAVNGDSRSREAVFQVLRDAGIDFKPSVTGVDTFSTYVLDLAGAQFLDPRYRPPDA
jgi:hypothetical protein